MSYLYDTLLQIICYYCRCVENIRKYLFTNIFLRVRIGVPIAGETGAVNSAVQYKLKCIFLAARSTLLNAYYKRVRRPSGLATPAWSSSLRDQDFERYGVASGRQKSVLLPLMKIKRRRQHNAEAHPYQTSGTSIDFKKRSERELCVGIYALSTLTLDSMLGA
jgi:hypothetical protein